MTERMIVAILRCSVFCICLISLVPAFKECKKIDQCSCSTDKGIISLWKLAGTDQPRFPNILCTGFLPCTVSWNPCTPYSRSVAGVPGNCRNAAACVALFGGILSIAKQSTATCELSTYGDCALKYTGEAGTSLTVTLICGSGNGTTTGMESRVTASSIHFKTVLHSKYACPLNSASPSTPLPTESSRPITGFNLLIAFCCVLVVFSFILGALFYKKTGGRFTCHLRPNLGVQCTERNDYTAI